MQGTVNSLRIFLRYCFEQRWIPKRLDLIERAAGFRHAQPPRAIKWTLIQRFLRSIDRKTVTGWRDFMFLHLMAHYGLRNGEITRLTLDSINWSDDTLLIEQTKNNNWVKLPLMEETQRLLKQYVQDHMLDNGDRHLFQNLLAPFGPVTKYNVSFSFKLWARRSGLPIAHASAYSLRHSFAMRLFGRGIGIKAIGDLMGHGSTISTAIYLRLQTDVLRELALPVPTMSKVVGGKMNTVASVGLQQAVTRYLAHKRALGWRYRGEQCVLSRLCRNLKKKGARDLTVDNFRWWSGCLEHRHPNTRIKYTQIVRNFCLYRQRHELDCFVPPDMRARRKPYVTPIILESEQVARMLHIASTYDATLISPLRALLVAAFIKATLAMTEEQADAPG